MPPPTLFVKGSLSGDIGEKNKHKIPIDYIIDRIKSKMYEYNRIKPTSVDDRIFIIRSETGSGKSTVLPAYVFRLLRGQYTGAKTQLSTAGVICTQPKVLTAENGWRQVYNRARWNDDNAPQYIERNMLTGEERPHEERG